MKNSSTFLIKGGNEEVGRDERLAQGTREKGVV